MLRTLYLPTAGAFLLLWFWYPIPPAKIVPGKETTRIMGPLKADGSVDYVKAFDEICGKGATKENNGAIAFLEAVGPTMLTQELQPTWKKLGIEPLPKEGMYLVDGYDLARGAFGQPTESGRDLRKELSKADIATVKKTGDNANEAGEWFTTAQEEAGKKPWKAADMPAMALMLKVNEKPLAKVVEASKRSHWYVPCDMGDEDAMMMAILLPSLGKTRAACRQLSARAMLRYGEGDFDGALADLLAGYRIGRHQARTPMLIHYLVAVSCNALMNQSVEALAVGGKLTAAQARQLLGELRKLEAMPPFALTLDIGERFGGLDAAGYIRRHGPRSIEAVTELPPITPFERAAMDRIYDPNIVMREMNLWYDRLVAAASMPTHRQRVEAMERFQDDVVKRKIASRDSFPGTIAKALALAPTDRRQYISKALTEILMSILLPATGSASSMAQQAETRFELTCTAVALAAHRAEHGKWPKALADISKDLLPAVPVDAFSDRPVMYRVNGDEMLLYSVGRNGTDDGGSEENYQDIVVRTPPKE